MSPHRAWWMAAAVLAGTAACTAQQPSPHVLDTAADTGSDDTAPDGCADDEVQECGSDRCFPRAMVGNGRCNNKGIDLDCERLGFDGGDCLGGEDTGDTGGGVACNPGWTLDCTGIQCADINWIGDGFCDNSPTLFDLNCAATAFDGGDCAEGDTGVLDTGGVDDWSCVGPNYPCGNGALTYTCCSVTQAQCGYLNQTADGGNHWYPCSGYNCQSAAVASLATCPP